MTFVETSVFMYAVGGDHPLRDVARAFFLEHVSSGEALATSSAVVRELLHAYHPIGRGETLDAALLLVARRMSSIWPVGPKDVELARELIKAHPSLDTRNGLHLALCRQLGIERLKTFDTALADAFASR